MKNSNWIDLICTIGPSSFDKSVLRKMKSQGVSLLRINMSHVSVKKMEEMIKTIREAVDLPICIDTEGSQIRTAEFEKGSIKVGKNEMIKITSQDIPGNKKIFSLRPLEAVRGLSEGDLIHVDYNKVLLVVVKRIDEDTLIARVISPGLIASNKAVNVDREIILPDLTPKDYEAIEVAKDYKINIYALSFARNEGAVKKIRLAAGKNSRIISKIETREAVINLDSIIQASDAILIDRGDLSREVPIEKIPAMQKMIISRAHKRPIPVYVATNLLESMVSIAQPTRAEVNDIANTLLDGANGLVLAAETAVGRYPIDCVNMVQKLIEQHEHDQKSQFAFQDTGCRRGQETKPAGDYFLSPLQTKEIFSHFGWKKVAAFCISELSDEIFEFIQDLFREFSELDGLLLNIISINPPSNSKSMRKKIALCKSLIEKHNLNDKVLVNELLIDYQISGLKELKQIACLCRDYGCSYLVLKTKVFKKMGFKKISDIINLLKEIEVLGIKPLYCEDEKAINLAR
ncbi:MAG: hypothetical protein JW867_04885 [Candidatus Omnitrophica bacterium]|nr:hypothetical protein [Candidatus Omnitrophota bacterium]